MINNRFNMEKKKRFLITQTAPAITVWTFDVEADSEEEAIRMVEEEEVEFDYSYVDYNADEKEIASIEEIDNIEDEE